MINGFIEAFQPDYVVETRDGRIREYSVNFPGKRSTCFAELLARDEQHRCQIGVDLRSICHDMYVEQFQFVQRHGPEVVIPICKDSRYSLLFSAMFGAFPEKTDVARVYIDALDGKHKKYEALEYTDIFDPRKLFPLRVTRHKLETFRNSYSWQSHLFYMDESSGGT